MSDCDTEHLLLALAIHDPERLGLAQQQCGPVQ